MQRVLVLVPVDTAMAGEVARGRALPAEVRAFVANEALAETFGLAGADADQAEYAALQVAQVAGLARHGRRLVLSAQVTPDGVIGPDPDEEHNGGVMLSGLVARSVEAFFAPDVPDDPVLVAGVAGLDVDEAWASPGVAELLANEPLAWRDVTELSEWLG